MRRRLHEKVCVGTESFHYREEIIEIKRNKGKKSGGDYYSINHQFNGIKLGDHSFKEKKKDK